jgi:hypothetical protein
MSWNRLQSVPHRGPPGASTENFSVVPKRHSSLRVTWPPVSTCPAPPWHGDRTLEGRRSHIELAFFLKAKKTPLLRPRLAHVVGQFTDTQPGDGISAGGEESRIHVDVIAPGLVGDFKDRRPRVLIPPSVPHLAEEFPLKILL